MGEVSLQVVDILASRGGSRFSGCAEASHLGSQAFFLFDCFCNRGVGGFDDHLKCVQMLPVFVHLLVVSLLELQEV
jgi:hypothetical protein